MLVLRWTLDANGRLTATYVRTQSRRRPHFLRDDAPKTVLTPQIAAGRLRRAATRGALLATASDKSPDPPTGLESLVSPTSG